MEQKKCGGRSEDVAQVKSNAATEHRWEWMYSNLEPGKAEYKCAQCGMRMWLADAQAGTGDLNQSEWATRNKGVCQGKNPTAGAYTLHGKPLAVGTRLRYLADEPLRDVCLVESIHPHRSGVVAIRVGGYPDIRYRQIFYLGHPEQEERWEVVEPTLNGETVDTGSWLVDSYGSYGRVQSWAWEADGVLRLGVSVYGQSSVPIAVRVWPDGTNQQWALWAPEASGEPIAVGDWIRIDEPSAPNVGVFRIVKLWPTPVDGPTRRLDVAATFEHGSYRSTRRLGDGTDGSYKARKLHPQGKDVNPVIGDLVKHPTQDVIGRISDIYGEYDRYVVVEWLGPTERAINKTDYNFQWARTAEKPLVLLREKTEPIVTQEELNEIEKVKQEKESGLLAFMAQGNPVEMKAPTDGGMSLKDLAAFAKAWDEAWKKEPLVLKPTQKVREHKCVADQACAPGMTATSYQLQHHCRYGMALNSSAPKDAALLAELKAEGWKEGPTWKPFPGYLPEKKGKYLVHFVEFGDCKVIRWKGTRWAKYNDSVSSFYSIPIEEIVPFVGAVSAPALTEQQLNELDPPEFRVGDTVYDPVAFPGKTGEVVEVTPGGLFPVRVQFGPKSTAVYTNNGRYQLNDFRRLTHIPYKPGYIIT